MIATTVGTHTDRERTRVPVNPQRTRSPLLPPSLGPNVAVWKDALSEPRSWTCSQIRPKQICRVSGVNPWETLNAVIADYCRECWQGPGDCEAAAGCQLYSLRTRKLREWKSADQMSAAIRKECAVCLGTKRLDSCTSPDCGLFGIGEDRKECLFNLA